MFRPVASSDGEALADLRVEAMRPSLERVGRFDLQRARSRFLDAFAPEHTREILASGERVGFFVLKPGDDGLVIDHLYVRASHQSQGIGAAVLREVFAEADKRGLDVRVGALVGSDSNGFYVRHGFALARQEAFDNYYVRRAFQLRPAGEPDFEFAFAAKRDAMLAHVARKWGWDEALQLELHRARWREKSWQIILVQEQPAGTVAIDVRPTHVQFGEFYILERFRRTGLGSRVLLHALAEADRLNLETRLEYLKWNPVASLYGRHGFLVVGETENHRLAVRKAQASRQVGG